LNYNNNDKSYNSTNVPELLYYNNQTLQLYIPSKKCHGTLYFLSEFSEFNVSNKIKKIMLKDKNYFVTFYGTDPVYQQHLKLLYLMK